MKILFLGNSLLWCSVKKLPHILNKLPYREDIEISCLYMATAKICHYIQYFDKNLTSRPHFNKESKVPNILFKYKYGNDKWQRRDMPDITIRSLLEKTDWDIVVLCGHSASATAWLYDKYKDYYAEYFDLIRACTKARLYWAWTFVPDSKHRAHRTFDSYKYFYNGELSLAKDEKEMFEVLNSFDSRVCEDNEVLPLEIRVAYEDLVDVFPNKQRLLIDQIHPDRGIGEYYTSAYIYSKFLKDIYNVDIKDIKLEINASKNKYDLSNEECVSVNKETKKIADEVLEQYLLKEETNETKRQY